MVEISKSGSGEGLGGVIPRGYSKRPCGGGAVWPALLVTRRRSHTTGMQSKVHPTYKTKYRVANWPAYNRALVRRGDVTVWVSSEAIAAWTPRRSGRRGGQRRYSDLAIETAMTRRLLSHLPLRGPSPAGSRSEDLLALLAQLALRPDVPVERHGGDPELSAECGHGGVAVLSLS